jgi:hypothetical protein
MNFKRSFSNSRLWPEVDPSQLVQLIGVIVKGIVQGFGKFTGDFGLGLLIAFDRFASVEPRALWRAAPSSESIVSLMMFLSIVTSLRASFLSMRLKVYLMVVVRGLSLVSRTKTASSFAGSVLLALRLIEWVAPGGSDQLSPAR